MKRLTSYGSLRFFRLATGVVLLGLLMAGCGASPGVGPVIGVCVTASSPAYDDTLEGVIAGLGEAGYEDGESATIDIQSGDNDRPVIQTIVQKFVGQSVDVLVVVGTPCLQAAIEATRDTPIAIVFGAVANPYRAGAAESADDHLPNVTGASASSPVAEQLDLARAVLPDISKVGWLWSAGQVNAEFYVEIGRARAEELGIELVEANVSTSSDVKQAAESVVARGAEAFVDGGDNIVSSAIDAVIGVAESSGIPFITIYPSMISQGALLAQGWDYVENGRATAGLVARVLEGEDPATIPFEALDVKRLVVNQGVADRLGVTIPNDLLERAEEVVQ